MAEVAVSRFVLGQDARVVGRVARLLLGGSSMLTSAGWMLGNASQWPAFGAAFVGALVFYLGVHRLLGWRPLGTEPWLATLVTLLPLGLLFAYPGLPGGVRAGVSSYIGASLVVNAAIAYGGCEVLAAAILLFRRRPTVYCPYNAIDAVERSMTHRGRNRAWTLLAVLAIGAKTFLLLVGPLLSWDGSELARQVVVLLLLLLMLALGWRTVRLHRCGAGAETRIAAVGALALLGTMWCSRGWRRRTWCGA